MRELEKATLHLTVPNDSKYLGMVRLVVASAAADLEFSYDAIEDLRIVADELISLVMSVAAPGTGVRVGIFPGPENFEFRGSAELANADEVSEDASSTTRGPAIELDLLAAQIVASLVDKFDVESHGQRIEVGFSVHCPNGQSDG